MPVLPKPIVYAQGASASPFGQSPDLYNMPSMANTPSTGLPNYSQLISQINPASPNFQQQFSNAWSAMPTAPTPQRAAPSSQYSPTLAKYQQQQQQGGNEASQIINQMMQTQNMWNAYNPQLTQFSQAPTTQLTDTQRLMYPDQAAQERAAVGQRMNQQNEWTTLSQRALQPYQQQLGNLAQQQYQQYQQGIPGNVRLPGGGWTKSYGAAPGQSSPADLRLQQEMSSINSNPYGFLSAYNSPVSSYASPLSYYA